MKLSGSITALVTPFKGRSVDEEALRRLVRFQLKNGTSTGEAATLHANEYRRAIEVVAGEADGRVPVIAGVGSNDTEKAVVLAKAARDAGADALLVLVPYYNKPTQEGMFRHFGTVAKAVPRPTTSPAARASTWLPPRWRASRRSSRTCSPSKRPPGRSTR